MSLFKNLPIKRKLMLIGLVTTGVAVVVLSLALSVAAWVGQRSQAANTIAVHASVIADNAAPALVFSDEKAAQEVLSRLKSEPSIVFAALLDRSGTVVAKMELPERRKSPPRLPAENERLFFSDQLIFAKAIVHDGETVGTLYLQSDLREIYSYLLFEIVLIGVAMALSLLVAGVFFARFQKAISDPIHDLVSAMQHVTLGSDFAVRATVQGRDEFSVLAQGFNTMLATIKEREKALSHYQAGLEATVKQRTAELENTNQGLRQQIEERLRMEQALKRSEASLAEAQRIAHIGNWELDVVSGGLFWSDEVYRIFGYSPGAVQPNFEFHLQRMHPEDVKLLEHAFQKALTDHLPNTFDYRILLPDGGERTVHLQGEVVLDAAGKPVRMIGTVQDITEYKTLEEGLKRLNETLEHRVTEELAKNMEKERLLIKQSRFAAMGEMIGNIAHQWRQPINALGLVLGNIKDAYDSHELDQATLDEAVAHGERLIHRMSSTIDDFRNFFRPDKEKSIFSLNEAVADALRILEATFRSAKITVSVEGDEDVMAYGYRNEYSQVLVNLLNNAKEALQGRKISDGRVRIKILRQDGQAEVDVEDNAGGIAPEILPKIFDPYFTTKEKGTGIGLYMSKMIIESSMNGSIEVREAEHGTQFAVITPLDAPQASNP